MLGYFMKICTFHKIPGMTSLVPGIFHIIFQEFQKHKKIFSLRQAFHSKISLNEHFYLIGCERYKLFGLFSLPIVEI